jgi:hypothetical protein
MKKINKIKLWLGCVLLLSSGLTWAGPVVEISDTATPPSLEGTIASWALTPVIVLDKKEQVVLGQNEWTGPDYASARVYMTYDQNNLYIAADITSKTPMYNGQEASNIYNGDALEFYAGTDLTDPKRTAYSPTDVQVFISPGKNGDNPVAYSMTDKAAIPDSKVTTKLIPNGYSIMAKIPLKFFYKIDVGPGKSIGFDLGFDDVGASSKVRALQLSWTQQDKSWQDPSQWGTLTFKGNTVFKNTTPKVAMPGAQATDLDPKDGAKGASTEGVLIWGFNDDVGGFEGSVTQVTDIVSEGTGALLVGSDGSAGWNQSLAVCKTIPIPDQWETFKTITMDAFFPPKSLAKAGYGELYLVTQSPANSWYEIKMISKEGWNHFKVDVDGSQFKGGLTKVFLVVNSGGPIQGNVVVDNIRGIVKGAATGLKGSVKDAAGKPIPGAIVALAKKLVQTGADGTYTMEVPADDYIAEVFCPGYVQYKENLKIESGKDNQWNVTMQSMNVTPKKAVIDAFLEPKNKVRTIQPHYLYGNNIAAWYDPKWLTNPTALQECAAISNYIRVPGGAYGNVWNWKTGAVFRKDGVNIQWTPDMKWADMVTYLKATNSEPLMIANMMTLDVQNCLDWIADAKAQGLTIRYVELGNEPDYESELAKNGETQYWTVIDNYCKAYLEFAKAIKAKYPDIKLMGPVPAQVENHERKEGQPWLAPQTAPWWVEKFLEECSPYVDVVSVHSYPYWSNDSDMNLMSKTNHWAEFIPKIREAIKKNMPDRADKIEIAVSEWNSGDENSTTARLVNGVFCADYLAQMALYGVNQSNIWDMMTQKAGQGGGHGVIDPQGDPDHPFALRSSYWTLYLLEHHFGTEIYQAVTDQEDMSAYASEGNGKKYLMVINKNPKNVYSAEINLGTGVTGKSKLDIYREGPNEYQWSENLYRAVINSGPSHLEGSQPVGSRFSMSFPPYSVTCIELTPAP